MSWIKVKDELPPIDTEVLVCVSPYATCPRLRVYDKEPYLAIDRFSVWEGRATPCFTSEEVWGKVTHWTELPDKPKQ